jgi:hypothetical protein|tara:strand:+ start:46 stop:240 length:195 start_codon:yes stop_codon:yes gene_type:complete
LGNPKVIIPIIAKGKCPSTTAVILNNLSFESLNIKFQRACKKAANKIADIKKNSGIFLPYIIRY